MGADPGLLVDEADRLAFETMLRGVVANVWDHDYREIFSVFGQRELRSVFEAARFPIDHLPEKITIYRGVAGRGDRIPARSGISWTVTWLVGLRCVCPHLAGRQCTIYRLVGTPICLQRRCVARQSG
jgi:hypothetical protein